MAGRAGEKSVVLLQGFADFGGMFRPFQNRVELHRFVERVRDLNPRAVLEIGTARGGTLILLASAAASDAELISIDLPGGSYGGGYPLWKGVLYRRLMRKGQRLELIRGNSHETRIFEQARKVLAGKQIDLLFIDGDHSYTGAKQDFPLYRGLVRPGGLIAFHDILDNPKAPDITVAPLWREIKGSFRTEEIVDSYEQGQLGIGIVAAPEKWDARRMCGLRSSKRRATMHGVTVRNYHSAELEITNWLRRKGCVLQVGNAGVGLKKPHDRSAVEPVLQDLSRSA